MPKTVLSPEHRYSVAIMKRFPSVLPIFLGAVWGTVVAGDGARSPTWEDINAIFAKRCVNCHSVHGAAKGLRLDSYEATVAGSENGAVVVAGFASESELVQRLRGESTPRMPFLSTPLPQEELDLIIRWVDAGTPKARISD